MSKTLRLRIFWTEKEISSRAFLKGKKKVFKVKVKEWVGYSNYLCLKKRFNEGSE